MRVFIVDFGSQLNIMIPLANSLAEKAETILMLPNNSQPQLLSQISDKVKFQDFHLYRRRDPRNIQTLAKIMKTIKKFNPDIIHIQSHLTPWIFLIALFLKNYTVINTIHDPKTHLGDKNNKGYSVAEYFGKICTKHYIVHGKHIKEELKINYNISSSIISVIPLGCSILSTSKSKKVEEEKETLLFFGRIWKYKGLEYLIKSEPLITSRIPNLKIIIAGTGENFQRYDKMIVNKSNFEIYNYRIPDSQMVEIFQRATILVLPYLEATQSGVLLLGFKFKKAVIATNVGSIPEIIEHGKNGYLVEPGDIKGLALAIIELLKNHNYRNQISNNAFEDTRKDLSWDSIAQKTMQVYKKVMKEG